MAKEDVNFRPISQLFQDSWKLFTKVWRVYLIYYVTMLVGFFAIVGASFGYPLARLVSENPNTTDITPQMVVSYWPYLALAIILLVFYSSFISLALGKTIYSKAMGKDLGIKEAMIYARQKFLPYLGLNLVSGLLIVLGFLLLIVPGFYALTVLSLVGVVFVVEDLSIQDAMKRSRELVMRNFWGVAGRIFLLFAILALIAGIFENAGLIQTIVNFLSSVITIGYIYYLYEDLK